MTTEQQTEVSQEVNGDKPAVGFIGKIEAKCRELKENAETYPYVWASYGVVYGGFGLWTLYRWRKLRNTETRVRALQEKLRQRYQAQEAEAAAAAASENASASAHVTKSAAVNASESAHVTKSSSENASTSAQSARVTKPSE